MSYLKRGKRTAALVLAVGCLVTAPAFACQSWVLWSYVSIVSAQGAVTPIQYHVSNVLSTAAECDALKEKSLAASFTGRQGVRRQGDDLVERHSDGTMIISGYECLPETMAPQQ